MLVTKEPAKNLLSFDLFFTSKTENQSACFQYSFFPPGKGHFYSQSLLRAVQKALQSYLETLCGGNCLKRIFFHALPKNAYMAVQHSSTNY